MKFTISELIGPFIIPVCEANDCTLDDLIKALQSNVISEEVQIQITIKRLGNCETVRMVKKSHLNDN